MKLRKTFLIIGACVLAAALSVGGIFLLLKANAEPVLVIPVAEVSMTGDFYGANYLYGYVRTDRMQAVFLTETQTVTGFHVSEGDTVKAGDPLLDYDTSLTDLQLQRKELEIQKQERELEKLQKEYKSLFGQNFTPPEPTAAVKNDAAKLSADFGAVLHLLSEVETAQTEEPPTETAPTEPTEEPTPSESTEPVTEETTEESTDAPDADYHLVGGSGTPEDPYLYLAADDSAMDLSALQSLLGNSASVSIVFAQCEGDTETGNVYSAWGMVLERAADGSCRMHLADASQYLGQPLVGGSSTPDVPIIGPGGGGGGMSYEELKKLRAEKEQEIIEKDLALRMAQVELKRMQTELGDGTVYAELDGVVLGINDPEDAYLNGEAVLKVSGGGGYCIEGAISELSLDDAMIGRAVTVTSWNNGMTYDGVIAEVSDIPTASGGWSDGNMNVSYYPFTVVVDETAELMDGEYVDMQLAGESGSEAFYLEKPYILQENGKSYVYALGENDRLEKREISIGKDLWGSYYEIYGGVTAEDLIAFPYGKNVTEGAKTKQGTLFDLQTQ